MFLPLLLLGAAGLGLYLLTRQDDEPPSDVTPTTDVASSPALPSKPQVHQANLWSTSQPQEAIRWVLVMRMPPGQPGEPIIALPYPAETATLNAQFLAHAIAASGARQFAVFVLRCQLDSRQHSDLLSGDLTVFQQGTCQDEWSVAF